MKKILLLLALFIFVIPLVGYSKTCSGTDNKGNKVDVTFSGGGMKVGSYRNVGFSKLPKKRWKDARKVEYYYTPAITHKIDHGGRTVYFALIISMQSARVIEIHVEPRRRVITRAINLPNCHL